jgi:RimJ/RimL family protein N-acetyltransferase
MEDHLTLRPVAEDDLPVIERLTQDPEATGEFAWLGWYKLTRFRQWFAENRLISDDIGVLMVVRGDERPGFVSWYKVPSTPGYYYWNIGIALLPEARGNGYGTEAQRLLARYLFAYTTVQRIEAATEAGNVAEQRALEKAGFTREGVLRGATFRAGRWHDQIIYSVLRDEVELSDPATGEAPSEGS